MTPARGGSSSASTGRRSSDTAEKIDGPAMTVLYYIMDGDDLLISTMLARGKAKAVQRNPKVSLCVLDENWPPTYITLFCDAVIDATVSSDPDAVRRLAPAGSRADGRPRA